VKVVSDASPLIALAKIGQFDLLRMLFTTVIVTSEVYSEVVVTGSGLPGSKETREAPWIRIQHLKNPSRPVSARGRSSLGLGELGSIALAKEIKADLILIDDLAARKLARAEVLRVQGTVGILESCFTRGYLVDLRQAYEQLLLQSVFLNREFLDARLRSHNLPPL
jgi:uncharacterized protein